MDIQNLILYLVALLDLILIILIWRSGRRNEASAAYSLFVLWVILWTIGIALFRQSTDHEYMLFWNREFIFSAALIASSLLHFSFVFPPSRNKISVVKKIFIYLPTLFILWAVLTPEDLLKDIVRRDWGNERILGWGYIYYGLYFVIISSWAFLNLFRKFLKSKGI